MGTPHANFALGLDPEGLGSHPRAFRRHKNLPHPRRDDAPRSSLLRYSLGNEAGLPQNGGLPGPAPSGRQREGRVGRGPEPPPTPPAHSRTSSASHPANPSTPRYAGTPPGSAENVESRPLATPPLQQTPPTPNLTPDRTPPGPATSQAARRPPMSERNSSKAMTDSRAASFRTARENPYSSDDDDGKSTLRPELPSAKTSQSTVRQVSRERSVSQPVGLGLGLGSSRTDDATTKTAPEFNKFDGEWTRGEAGANEAEKEWDPSLMKNVTVRRRRPTRTKEAHRQEILDDRAVTPTNAARALRSMSLEESPIVYPSRRAVSDRFPTRAAPATESSSSIDIKRSSVMSTKSNASTVVEAVLFETAPQRQKTLRHMRKQIALRHSGSEFSPASSAPTSVSPAVDGRRQRHESSVSKAGEAVRDSYASAATNNSISSRKARRSVWKSGGVPVVVIPERRSSVKSNSKTPSLRSTSSRRSPSVSSVPTSQPSKSRENVPHFERRTRRSRALSESDGSRAGDERTMDFAPVIPTRSSSLSAPTSRNVSRTGSLTAESLTAHNIFQAQQAHHALQKASRELDKLYKPAPAAGDDRPRRVTDRPPTNGETERRQPTVSVERARGRRGEPGGSPAQINRNSTNRDSTNRDSYYPHSENGGLGVDRDGDPFFGKRLSVQNTPFSVASVETTVTSHAEVSEAMAVNIYPHQSKSIVLVEHSAKPSESSSIEQYKISTQSIPVVNMTDANGDAPVTPPQQFPVDDVDSPLRNPRAPPKPPVINFIPATPSGLTPTTEKQKQLGNYHEMTAEKPKRSLSLLRRTLTRRTAEYGPSPSRPIGFLHRTFSLSRNIGRRGDRAERPRLKRHSTADSMPPDESRLHPYWRPAYADDESYSDDEYDEDDDEDDDDEEDRTYRYPPIDNRPALPRRRLSDRIKRTFAILPVRDDYDDYPATGDDAPDRRTIRRTPSGNLRVMKFRRSMESLTRGVQAEEKQPEDKQAYTPGRHPPRSGTTRGYTRLWRSLSGKARSLRGRSPHPTAPAPVAPTREGTTGGFLPTLGDRINFPRRLSERRREKRTQELRGKISGPRDVRDGVGDVIRRNSWRDYRAQQTQKPLYQDGHRDDHRDAGVGADARPDRHRDVDALYVQEQQRERQRVREGRV